MSEGRHKYQRKNVREVRIVGSIAFVDLTKGKTSVIDAADVPLVEGWSWQASKNQRGIFYGGRKIRKGGIRKWRWLHHMICPPPIGSIVDHIDGNPLNNRRSNLRAVSTWENANNLRCHRMNGQAGFLARVHRDNRSGKCEVRLTLGWFPNEQAAVAMRDRFNETAIPEIKKALRSN